MALGVGERAILGRQVLDEVGRIWGTGRFASLVRARSRCAHTAKAAVKYMCEVSE